jgi:hypothetical protein
MDAEAIDRGEVVEWRERLGRIGFAAKGVLYGIIAVIAIAVALGGEQSTADQTGALASLAGSTAGKALLAAVAIGLGAMALCVLGVAGHLAWAGARARTPVVSLR